MAVIEQQSGTDAHQERAPWEHKTTTPGAMFSGVANSINHDKLQSSTIIVIKDNRLKQISSEDNKYHPTRNSQSIKKNWNATDNNVS